MYRVAVCVPTYKRPVMLEKLITSIFAGEPDPALIRHIDLIVVDNDADRTAQRTVARLAEKARAGYAVHYHNFPIKGLVNVRNELIRQALQRQPDFLAFIDDDEYACSDWLNELMLTLVENKGDLAVGPVIPTFESKVPAYIAYWFRHHRYDNHANIDFIETGNLAVRAKLLEEDPEMRFDHRFNTTGAEDSYFGVTAQKKGIRIWWAARAVAYETIPEKRATISWLLRRAYRGAVTYTFIILLEKKYGRIFKKILVNFVYLFVGIMALIFTPFQVKYRYYGILKIAESMGGFAGLMNLKYHEYAKGR